MKQREIKFRIWDKTLGMDYNPKLGLANNDLNNQFATALGELMQYTGLKDKNGKEIYEGDVVKDKQGKVVSVTFGNGGEGEPADYVGGYFGWCFGNDETTGGGFGWGNEYEIIGNIYENPELLTTK